MMVQSNRQTRPRVLLAVLTAAALLLTGALSPVTGKARAGSITACKTKSGKLKLARGGRCPRGWSRLTLSSGVTRGPRGGIGPAGPVGPAGPAGPTALTMIGTTTPLGGTTSIAKGGPNTQVLFNPGWGWRLEARCIVGGNPAGLRPAIFAVNDSTAKFQVSWLSQGAYVPVYQQLGVLKESELTDPTAFIQTGATGALAPLYGMAYSDENRKSVVFWILAFADAPSNQCRFYGSVLASS